MENPALGPLDLVKLSESKEAPKRPSIDIDGVVETLENVVQTAATYINTDAYQEFLYKNPNGWKRRLKPRENQTSRDFYKADDNDDADVDDEKGATKQSSVTSSSSTYDEDLDQPLVPWPSIADFEFRSVVRQITQFCETWDLSPATKFVVIAHEKNDVIESFGERYNIEVHFSKPTPKCPNPLAVAKVYFNVNISYLLPRDYPINVTYRFEGYRTIYHSMGERKLDSQVFQRYFIDSILHMKLAFYAELCERRNPMNGNETN